MTAPAAAAPATPSGQLQLPMEAPAEPPNWARRTQDVTVDHASRQRARRAVLLRERFYGEHLPDIAVRERFVVVAVPVPPGWRVAFGNPPVRAFGCVGTLLTGQVTDGSVLVEFPLAALRAALDRHAAAQPAGPHTARYRAA
jgi:hypothetical protein